MKDRSKSLLGYLGMSAGWLVAMAVWPLIVGPSTDPHCLTSASFGFLPAIMVIPFLILPLYLLSVAVHAVFAFRTARFAFVQRHGVALLGADALFFVPAVMIALLAYSSALRWSEAWHCSLAMFVLVLPWLIAPVANGRFLSWSA
jgi:hypothetical protein